MENLYKEQELIDSIDNAMNQGFKEEAIALVEYRTKIMILQDLILDLREISLDIKAIQLANNTQEVVEEEEVQEAGGSVACWLHSASDKDRYCKYCAGVGVGVIGGL